MGKGYTCSQTVFMQNFGHLQKQLYWHFLSCGRTIHLQRQSFTENIGVSVDFCEEIYKLGLTKLQNICLSISGKGLTLLGMDPSSSDLGDINQPIEVL
jgi:hypothetical protein